MTDSFFKKSILVFLFFIFITKINATSLLGTIPFITTWKTDNPGASANNQITIPTSGSGYNYTVDWGDGTTSTNQIGNATHTYVIPGTYTVSITGLFPRIAFKNAGGDNEKILTIEQWGDNQWKSMKQAFESCINLQGHFTDKPNLSKATDISLMFKNASSFNYNIDNWDVSTITDMSSVFSGATSFNQSLENWDVSKVTLMSNMFKNAIAFNQDLNNWNVSSVRYMDSMLQGTSSFNGSIKDWNVSNVYDMQYMFYGASSFNQTIENWNVSTVNNMTYMFFGTSLFNQDISRWNVSNVFSMGYMFSGASSFNQDIGNWNVSHVFSMYYMFYGASSFNQDISEWNVSNVGDMYYMFSGASSFNQDIGNWNVNNVQRIYNMFENATSFNQDISKWNVSNIYNMTDILLGAKLSVSNYDALLIGWNSQVLKPNINFNGGNSKYCAGAAARGNLINSDNWSINDGGIASPTINDLNNQNVSGSYTLPAIIGIDLSGNEKYYTGTNGTGTAYKAGDIINFPDFVTYPVTLYIYDSGTSTCSAEQDFQLVINKVNSPFITTWKTDNPGTSNNNQISIPTFGGGYNYIVDWGDGTTPTNETGNALHTYTTPGIYIVSISGDFPAIVFNDKGDKDKMLTIEHWGSNPWKSMFAAFQGCSNLQGNYTDSPDLSHVTSTEFMFAGATSFNSTVDNWNVSTITKMGSMFSDATSFNQNIKNWNVGNVDNMEFMFKGATTFNQYLGDWDVSKVTTMGAMFAEASTFNQNIGNWNVGNVDNMEFMFYQAKSFNQNIGNWNVSNVQVMEAMFAKATIFNQDINKWNTSKVNDMGAMFYMAPSFNQNIGNWDVSKVTRMEIMFYGSTSFNQNIGRWNVISATNMISMFEKATTFNQNLGNWNVTNVTDMSKMFEGVKLSIANYDALLIGWNAQNLKSNVPFSGGLSQYCLGVVARANMLSSDHWTITDAGTAAPNLNDIVDQNVSNNYTLPTITGTNLTGNEKYYTSSNGLGISYKAGDIINFSDFASYPIVLYIYDSLISGCSSEQNFQLTITSIPLCTTLTNPIANSTNVSVRTNLTWNSVPSATGYKLSIGTSSGATDILNKMDVGNILNYNLTVDLPKNTSIYVNITPYNLIGNAIGCIEEKFTTEQTTLAPICTTLTNPLANSTNVSVGTDLTWSLVSNATSYKLSIGTSSGATDLLNKMDVGNVLNYDLAVDLPNNTLIYVNITPYNLSGNAIGCNEERFTTEQIISLPSCTTVTKPTPNSTNVSVGTNLTWTSVSNATGYKLSIGRNSGATDLLNKIDVGNVLKYNLATDLPENTQIYIKITPYNLSGDAIGCPNSSFITESIAVVEIVMPPKFFTPNNDGVHDTWIIPNLLNNTLSSIYIFDRYGKLIKQVIDFSSGWDGTYINKPLPAEDYWYLINYKNGEMLKGHFSLVR